MIKQQKELLDYTRNYIKKHFSGLNGEKKNINRSLNYLLCGAIDRIFDEFGEVTKKDLILLIESWVMAQGTNPNHKTPMTENNYINCED